MPSIDPKYFAVSSSSLSSPTSTHPRAYPSSLFASLRSARLLFYFSFLQSVLLVLCVIWWLRGDLRLDGDVHALGGGRRGEESWCRSDFGKGVCEVYGAENVKLSRLYEGTATRLKTVFHRAQTQKSPLRIAALGGSVTVGHGLQSKDTELWFNRISQTLSSLHGPRMSMINGAVPAVGSRYFSSCFSSHMPSEEVDVVFVELSINDVYRREDAESFEMLLRGLLELPQQPAVVVVQTISLAADSLAVGGDLHLPVAAFYDVPVISLRPLVLPVMMEGGKGLDYFVSDGWGYEDYRHINARSHAALADLVSSFLLEQWEQAYTFDPPVFFPPPSLAPLIPSPPSNSPPSIPESSSPLHPYLWPGAGRLLGVPKTLLFQKYDPSTPLEPLVPVCYTASQGTYANSIFPLLTSNQNWTSLTPPSTPDKTYLFASAPSSTFTLPVPVRLGTIQIYYLRAGGRTDEYGLGSVECWIGDDWEGRKRFDGHWDDWRPHIGEFGVVATGLPSGTHQLSCRLMHETNDPGGGTNFRILSVAGV